MNVFSFFNPKKKSDSVTMDEAMALVDSALWENRDELLNEAASSAEALLNDDDYGFDRLGESSKSQIFTDKFRRDLVRTSRVLVEADGISKQSVGLYTDFSVGTGMNTTIKGDESEKASNLLYDFINNPKNKQVFGAQNQRGLSDKLLTDGEIFFVIFTSNSGDMVIRYIDCLEIEEIAKDPDDEFSPMFYRRVRNVAVPSGKRWGISTKTKKDTKVYADWTNDNGSGKYGTGVWKDGTKVSAPTNKNLGVIFHVKLKATLDRSYPLITAQIKFSTAYRKFVRSRMAIQQGLARIIKIITTKGGKNHINRLKARHQSSKTQSDAPESNPSPAYASTQIQNDLVKTQTVKQETGAEAAKIDGSMLLSGAGTAVGIFPHYFGYGDSFRLATATAMEVPMLKRFEAYRNLWIEVYAEMFFYYLQRNGINTRHISFDINYPDIFPKAMTDKVKAITLVAETLPALKKSEDLNKLALDELGVTDSDKIVNDVDMEDNDTHKQVHDPNEGITKPKDRDRDGDDKDE